MAPELALFNAALGLTSPWQVVKVDFDKEAKELHLYVDFPRHSRFACPECQAPCPAYDSERDKVWRHLNFFEHKTFLHARFPRIDCQTCGIKTVEGPWARQGSGFTLLFEAFVLILCKQMPVLAAANLVGEQDTRLWRLVEHYVDAARAQEDMSRITSVCIDETASRRGHEYVTLFADSDHARVVLVAPGKDAATVRAFEKALTEHGAKPEQIQTICCDMSAAFESAVYETFPSATQVVDRFHVMRLVNDAIDKVRRAEVKEHPELKKTRYIWLKNPEALTQRQKEKRDTVSGTALLTVHAYQMKLSLQKLWEFSNREQARAHLVRWCRDCQSIPALAQVAATLLAQAERILNYFTTGGLTNGLLEGINSLVQAAKAKARGFRTNRYLSTIIYLISGKLSFPLPILNSG